MIANARADGKIARPQALDVEALPRMFRGPARLLLRQPPLRFVLVGTGYGALIYYGLGLANWVVCRLATGHGFTHDPRPLGWDRPSHIFALIIVAPFLETVLAILLLRGLMALRVHGWSLVLLAGFIMTVLHSLPNAWEALSIGMGQVLLTTTLVHWGGRSWCQAFALASSVHLLYNCMVVIDWWLILARLL